MSVSNKVIVRSVFEDVFNGRKLSLVKDLYAENFVGLDPANPVEINGTKMLTSLLEGYNTAFPEHKYKVHEIIGEGDFVAVRWSVHNPGSDRFAETQTEGLSLIQLENGKIQTVWQHWDNLGLLKDLGVIDKNIDVSSALK